MDYIHHFFSPIGGITLASDGEAIVGLWFDGQKHFGLSLSPEREERPLPLFRLADLWLETYFSGKDPGAPPPLAPRGTVFRQEVWAVLRAVPFGQTTTYGAIARQIAQIRGLPEMSARAVGSAVARNPISLFIPCHRVVGAGGALTGYAGGLDRKKWLLELERRTK